MAEPNRNQVGEKLFDSWLQTALEYDRSMLLVASAGLGLVATLADKPSQGALLTKSILVIAGVAFGVVVLLVLAIFRTNKSFILSQDGSPKEKRVERQLKCMDSLVAISFLVGIVSVVIASGFLIFQIGHKQMNNEKTADEILKMALSGELHTGMESLVDVKQVAARFVGTPASTPTPLAVQQVPSCVPSSTPETQKASAKAVEPKTPAKP